MRLSKAATTTALVVCFLTASAAAGDWSIRGGAAYANPDGSYKTQRANGKIVTSDIDEGVLFSLSAERQLSPRLGITLGGMFSEHHFIIHQDFPDGTEAEARDGFRFRAITAGLAIHFFRDKFTHLILEPFLLFAWYDDVSLSSHGPPYDRNASIDVDVRPQPGVGLIASLELPLSKQLVSLDPYVGLAIVRFTGPFPADPNIPGSEGDIGVGFSPLIVGANIGLHL